MSLSIKKKKGKVCKHFHRRPYCVTHLLSTLPKPIVLHSKKRRFCKVKAAVLHRKTYAFATSNRNYRFFVRIIFTKQGWFPCKTTLYTLRICGRGVGVEFIPFLIAILPFPYNNVAVSLVLGNVMKHAPSAFAARTSTKLRRREGGLLGLQFIALELHT